MRSVIFAIVLMSTTLSSLDIFGQVWTENNKIYLEYKVSDGMAPCLWQTGLYTVPLILRNPYNDSFDGGVGRSVNRVSGFECKIEVFGDVQILGVRYPVFSVNAGTGDDYFVGYSEPIYAGQETVLAEIDLLIGVAAVNPMPPEMATAAGPIDCSHYSGKLLLGPTFRASVAGKMAFLDGNDPDDPLVVGATRYSLEDRADLWTQPRPVASTGATWGLVKALYR